MSSCLSNSLAKRNFLSLPFYLLLSIEHNIQVIYKRLCLYIPKYIMFIIYLSFVSLITLGLKGEDKYVYKPLEKQKESIIGSGTNELAEVNLLQTSGTISIILKNINVTTSPYPGSNGRINIHDNNGGFLTTLNTNSNGVASGTFPLGTYHIEGYHLTSTIFGREFWGGLSINHNSSTTARDLVRHNPYFERVRVYNHSTGQEITGGSVNQGTQLRFEVLVRNPASYGITSRVRLVVDRSKSTTFDFNSYSPSASISSGGQRIYTLYYTPSF